MLGVEQGSLRCPAQQVITTASQLQRQLACTIETPCKAYPCACRAAVGGYRSSAPSREVSSDLTCSWMELISSSVRLRSMER